MTPSSHLAASSCDPTTDDRRADETAATSVDVGLLDSPFRRMDIASASADREVPWKTVCQQALNASSFHPFRHNQQQRWADMSSSSRLSSELAENEASDCGTSPVGSGADNTVAPAPRVSPLGQFQYVGFNVTSSGHVDNTEVPLLHSHSDHPPQKFRNSSFENFDGVSGQTGNEVTLPRLFVASDEMQLAAVHLRAGRLSTDGITEDGELKRGYEGLVDMLSIRASEDNSRGSESFVAAVPTGAVDHPSAIRRLVHRVAKGILAGQPPQVVRDGMGGAYFLRGSDGQMAGIFKPCDEEPFAPNNPKGWGGRPMGAPGMKPSVRVGEAALREVAAYCLDHDGFVGVPPAVLAEVCHPTLSYPALSGAAGADHAAVDQRTLSAPSSGIAQALGMERLSRRNASNDNRGTVSVGAMPGQAKVGSLQQYVTHICDANDMSSSRFSVPSVHRIGILDVRIFNCDRHAGNLLVGKAKMAAFGNRLEQDMLQLIPIDHGFSLPEAMDNPYFEWLYWPQSSLPFGAAELKYIADLSVQDDIRKLRLHIPLLREECLRCLEVTTTVLKMAAAAGLTLCEIGSMMTRTESLDEILPSDLEVMCIDAREEALAAESPSAASYPSCALSPRSTQGSMLAWGSMLPACGEEEEEESIFQLEGDSMGALRKAVHISYTCLSVGVSDDGSGALLASPPSFESPERKLFCRAEDVPSGQGQQGLHGLPCSTTAPLLQRHVSSYAGGVECGRAKHIARRTWRHKRHTCDGKRPTYPPLITGDHPGMVNYVFSGLSAAQWEIFMAAVKDWCKEELENQTWKLTIDNTGVTGSCPAVCGGVMPSRLPPSRRQPK